MEVTRGVQGWVCTGQHIPRKHFPGKIETEGTISLGRACPPESSGPPGNNVIPENEDGAKLLKYPALDTKKSVTALVLTAYNIYIQENA